MNTIEAFFSIIRFKLSTRLKMFKIFVYGIYADIRHAIHVKRELSKCPDEESRERELMKIIAEDKAKREAAERSIRLFAQLTMEMIKLVGALYSFYDCLEDETITEEDRESLRQLFNKSKDAALMNARWLILGGETFLEDFTALLESFEIDSYPDGDGLEAFMEKLTDAYRRPA